MCTSNLMSQRENIPSTCTNRTNFQPDENYFFADLIFQGVCVMTDILVVCTINGLTMYIYLPTDNHLSCYGMTYLTLDYTHPDFFIREGLIQPNQEVYGPEKEVHIDIFNHPPWKLIEKT